MLKDAIDKLNGIFKLPQKVKVSGLSGILSQDNDQDETEPSHDSYDNTNVNNLRNEITRTVRERYIRSGIVKKNKKNIYQHHTIVYDSNYKVTWSGKILKGALIDNRKDKHLIALENKDCSSKDQCQRTLDKWFLGYNTKIRFLMRVIPDIL